ncbi:protein FAR1-RELATED SEQUENCE [Trifolium repens]|nr:protein FAR1-RELATED SEQUENCE [Trifolium repens]
MKDIEKYQIHDFVDKHNHHLHLPETSHMLSCQRKLSEVQAHEINLADDAGIKQRALFELMSRQVGGRENLGYTRLDQKNYLRIKRLRNMAYGEVGSLLQHFQQKSIENPSFYHGVQLDVDEQITNIFWADARMIMDYEYFGDVVTLDTTYSTNNTCRPLAVFAGFNHFRGVVIFGAALLYDETAESFEWLFREFLKAHKSKRPQTIFTDQDHAMAKALREVIPETYHGLCTWHLMQNAIKHLSKFVKNGPNLLGELKLCMYKYLEEVDFQRAWDKMVEDYKLQESDWMLGLYKIKEKWAKCYMKNTMTIGMRSTQLSESVNADLKTFLKPDLDIIQFFTHFDRVVSDKRYNELHREFESRQKLPRLKMEHSPLLQQVSQTYTLPIFDLFQKEYDKYSAAYIKEEKEGEPNHEYLVSLYNENEECKVLFNPSTDTISCSCRKFETLGILCCHVIKVLDVKDIKTIPNQYILKRWTREAKLGCVEDTHGRKVQEDVNIDSTQWYREVCPKLVRIATRASDCKEARIYVETVIKELDKKVYEICGDNLELIDKNANLSSVEPNNNKKSLQSKSLKRRNGVKAFRKRPKSWNEIELTKKKRGRSTSISQNKNKENIVSNSTCGVSNSQPLYFPSNAHGYKEKESIVSDNICGISNSQPLQFDSNTHSFTRLLMEPIGDTFLQSRSVGFNQVSNHMSMWLPNQQRES